MTETMCGLAGATNGRAGAARAHNFSHSEDSVAETALSKKNSDGKEQLALHLVSLLTLVNLVEPHSPQAC